MLALLALALTIIAPTVLLYFLVIKGTDRYEPEPLWLLAFAFFWGSVVATLTAIVGNALGEGAVSLALGARSGDPLVQASTASFVAPVVEETTKGIGLLFIWGLAALKVRELDGALDGAVYGGVVGLGFTLTEDVLYVTSAGAQGGPAALTGLYILRTVFGGLGHASFTAMTGLGVGIAVECRGLGLKLLACFGGWVAAVGLHFFHNALVTFLYQDGLGLGLKLLAFWIFDALFFVLIVCLAVRDRSIVLRGLVDEVGRLLHPLEFARTTSYFMLVPAWNLFSLKGSPGGRAQAREKQLLLIELAFLKHRRRLGHSGDELDREEAALRSRIYDFNQRGVFIGRR